jgi:hypothetical protein
MTAFEMLGWRTCLDQLTGRLVEYFVPVAKQSEEVLKID